MKNQLSVDWQGHRGARGLLPENTIPAFKKALDLGMTTLELDVAVSADSQLIISHEPWMSAEICKKENGEEIGEEEATSIRIFELSYEEIKKYDCGTKAHSRFPQQEKRKTYKPSLKEMVQEVEAYAKEKNYPLPQYNIEIKSEESYDGIFTPEIATFVALTIKEIRDLGIEKRSNLQSFDLRALEEIHRQAPEITLAYLVEENENIEENLSLLSFLPEIYSPYHILVNQETMQVAKAKGMKVIPWTVNEKEEMKRLIDLGVDGIITDYPDRKI